MHDRNNGFDYLVEFWFQAAEGMIKLIAEGITLIINITTNL
jgi:hypothetical protein